MVTAGSVSDEGWQSADVRGVQLKWSSEGSGPSVVWAHAVSTDSRGLEDAGMLDWSPVAARHRLLRYDARGHGRSIGHPVPAEFTFPSFAADLLALLDVVAAGEVVSGIGASLGTATLLHAVVADPGRFDRLVLAAPSTAWDGRAQTAGMYTATADLIERDGAAAFAAMVRSAGSPPIFRDLPDYPPRAAVPEALLPSLFRGLGSTDLPARDAVAAIRVPVLVLGWASDPLHPVSSAHQLAELIPGAELHIAESVGDVAGWGKLAAEFLG